MNKIIIVALLLALVSCGIHKSNVRLQDTKTVFAELDQDAFGSTIISTIALNASTQHPVEEIIVLLEEIVDQLTTEQAEADEKNRTEQAICDETISSLKNQIAETTATISATEKAIVENTAILTQAKVDLAQADKDYEETVELIETGTAKREADHARWAQEDYENQISIATLEEGVKLINHMIHGVAFSQIKSRYEKVLDQFKDDTNKHASLFKPLISSLTQLATKLNYENVMKILDLLNNIRISIVEEREQARIEEDKAQADWDKLLSHLLSEKQRLSDKRARLRSLIEATETLLVQLKESLENNKVQLENLTQSLATQTQWCSEQSNTYITETDERTRESSIINKVIDHCKEKYAQVTDYVAGRQ